MTTPDMDTLQQQLRAVVRELQKVASRVDDLTTLANDAKDTADAADRAAARLAEDIVEVVRGGQGEAPQDQGGEEEEALPAALTWLTVSDPDEAAKLIDGLSEWLATVYCRWTDKPLPECWAWHPQVVAELLALREAWVSATAPASASPAKQMDWVERYRPSTARRITTETKGCSLADHLASQPNAYQPPKVVGAEMLGELTEWWARTGGRAAAPQPNPAMLAEANARRVVI